MDDEPMWVADRVVAPTPGSAIIIPETANECAIKGNHLTLVKGNQFDGRTKTDPHKRIHEFLKICDMFKYRDTENEAVRLMIRFFPPSLFDRPLGEIHAFSQHENESLTDAWLRMKEMLRNCHGHNLSKGNIIKIFYHGLSEITQEVLNAAASVAFADEGSSDTNTDKIIIRMDAMTIKMDAQYKELQSRAKQPTPDLDDDDMPMSREEEAKFIDDEDDEPTQQPKTQPTKPVKETPLPKPYKPKISLADTSFQYPVGIDENMLVEVGKFTFLADFIILEMEQDSKVPLILGRPFLHTADAVIRVKQKQLNLGVGTERMIFNIDSAMKHSYSNDDTCFSINEILEEDFNALLDEGSKILHSIEGTLLEEEIFFEFDKFM
ncbi:reverse transcriptase domain-containing protein [Tanacetum coccineum]